MRAAAAARRSSTWPLVGDQPVGTHVLVFLGAAREVLDPLRAAQIADALEAMERVMAGDSNIDHLFADLIAREPQLPEHLRAQAAATEGN